MKIPTPLRLAVVAQVLMCDFVEVGRPTPATARLTQPLDIIKLFHLGPQGIFEKAAPLYRSGSSLRELARELQIPQTTLRKTLLDGGMDLRPSNRVRNSLPTNIKRPHIGVSPYGYCIIRGSLVEVPKEQEVIRLVLKLRSENKTLSAIAEHLNKHRVKPRNAKRWDHSTVNSIIKRNIKKQSKEDHYDSK